MTSLVTTTKHARVGVLTLNNPPVNALSHALRVALFEHLKAASADSDIDAVVIACAGRTFVAGADIREFGKPPLAPDLPELVEFLDTIDKPLVAALHGTALGGGLELALACHYRIADGGARVGLPEVTLGILPGAGGTQRLPRVVGVRAALDLIVRGTIIPVTAARVLGLIDEIASGELTARAVAFAESVVAQPRPLRRASALSVSLDDPAVFDEYEELIARQWRGFLAPSRCIAAVRAAVELPFAAGLRRERELFAELMSSAESRAQRHVFFSEREIARVPGLPEGTLARPVKSVSVVGSGPLAEQILACFAAAGVPVAALADTDLAIEAVPENVAAKREALAQLDAVCKPGAILAVTTSWLNLEDLASATGRPEDVIGMHFVGPADTAKVLENARGPQSGPEACATAMKVGKSLGKMSVLVASRPGLIADRLRARSAFEALRLLEEGASAAQIDRVLHDFGLPTGWDAASERDPSSEPGSSASHGVLRELQWLRAVEWPEWRRLGSDAKAFDGAIARALSRGYSERDAARKPIPDRELLERCVFSMINEGARILDDKVVTRPVEIDMICVHGLGFPVYRGGPLFYADELGLAAVHQATIKYQAEVDVATWTPAALLQRLAAAGGRFYAVPGAEPR